MPYIELDATYHQPGWVPLAEDDFRKAVQNMVTGEIWVIDGNYAIARPIVWGRADTVVWLDPSRPVAMFRIIKRTLWRGLLRQELRNGNREDVRNIFTRDPMRDPQWHRITFVRLRTHAKSRRFMAEAAGPARN